MTVRSDDRPAIDLNLADFLDGVFPAIVVFDSRDQVAFANTGALELLRQPRPSVIGHPISGVFRTCVERARQRMGASGYVAFEQYVAQRWYMVQHYLLKGIRDPSIGQLTLLSLTDVSERRSREIELVENISGLEEATRIARMGTFRIDNAADKVVWSPHMYTLHGVTPDRWRPEIENYPTLIVPEDRARVRHQMDNMGADGDGGVMEYRIQRPDGEIRWMQLDRRVLFDPNEVPYGTFGTIQDVTEAKNREYELRQLLVRNAILSEALESSPIGVAIVGIDGGSARVVYVNAAFGKLTHYQVSDLDGAGLATLAPLDRAHRFGEVTASLSGALGASIETDCRRADGSVFPAQIEIAPVRDRDAIDRPPANFVVNVRDLTEDKKRAAALLQSQKMEALGQLSGGVAHEINNLLQPVIALSDLGMLMIGRDNDKALEYLGVIASSGRKAREIVRQVLTYARRDPAVLSRQNLVPLMFDAINLAQKGLAPGIELRVHVDSTQILADISATQMSQVVLNLVRNGADAISGQGYVDVTLAEVVLDDDEAARAGLEPGIWARLSVSDTGCGMDDETRKRVFEPFFTTKPVGRGTGLGLSVVHSIATIWGGTVTIDSKVDAGTRVVIYIPVKTDNAPP